MEEFRSEYPIGAIILAAGASIRMGAVKQLLPWKNSTLLEYSIQQLSESDVNQLVVVLGANEKVIRENSNLQCTDVVVNPEWEKGMATSIATGLGHLLKKTPDMQAVLIALVDQPLLDFNYYNKLIQKKLVVVSEIVCSAYFDQLGVPAVFGREYFDNLLNLEGSKGARALLREGNVKVATIDAGDLAVDLDTKESYNRIYELHGSS
jgi:molybdenum cofactor cytidylyltransferase